MIHPHHSHGPAGRGALQPSAAGAIDPVCGMTVDPAAAKGGSFEHLGVAYHFCNPKCREKFAADPARYLQKNHAASAAEKRRAAHHPRRAGADLAEADRHEREVVLAELDGLDGHGRSV